MNVNMPVRLVVTGGMGFIARGVFEGCVINELPCRAVSRSSRPSWAGQAIQWSPVPTYDDEAALRQALGTTKYVLHLADNSVRNEERDPTEALRICDALINTARNNGVEGIIVASSVYARDSSGLSSYGAVKHAIEDKFLSASGFRTIVLRLPPVYGPGGRGGLSTLSKLVRRGVPLPLARANAPRAYLSRRNLASLIIAMTNAENAAWRNMAGKIFEPSDGTPVSTRDLVRHMAAMMGTTPRLLPVPLSLLRMAAVATDKTELISGAIDRLDVAPAKELEAAFGWRPVEKMPESLAFLADEFRSA